MDIWLLQGWKANGRQTEGLKVVSIICDNSVVKRFDTCTAIHNILVRSKTLALPSAATVLKRQLSRRTK